MVSDTEQGIPTKRLLQIVSRFPDRKILVIGDLMLDHFLRGRVNRISPEAPVPVVRIHQETYVPGGAGNVAGNLASLSAAVNLIGVVGTDESGFKLVADLKNRGIETSAIFRDGERPTTEKVRIIAEHQQVVRYDRESTSTITPKAELEILKSMTKEIPHCHAVILSDYGKGVISKKILSTAIRLAKHYHLPITVDPKVEHFKNYKHVTCITPNMAEAWGGMRLLPREDESSIRKLGSKILRALKSESVLITRGEKGMTLFQNHAPLAVTHIPAISREVFDVTGAGDTVIAVLSLGLACGAKLLEAAKLANYAAGLVVGKLGTATVTQEELKKVMQS
ncbi:MAG: D-glycero-beta-D-manno-heptose-7-phosphate kinase [Elusimicrobia bacterium]|nr:D-glycero-beta-D-manno-heptose-7-phosphate kinase [Elusimicrobiota bacterium]